MKTFLHLICLGLFTTGCAFHSGMMTGNASLASNNFKITGMAMGSASTFKILGIGGLGRQGLVMDAKKRLMENAKLQPGQALANVTVDVKRAYLFIAWTTEVTVTADIVDFDLNRQAGANTLPSVQDTSLINKVQKPEDLVDLQHIETHNGFSTGEKVQFKIGLTTYEGLIKEFRTNNVVIAYRNREGAVITIVKPYEQIHKVKQ